MRPVKGRQRRPGSGCLSAGLRLSSAVVGGIRRSRRPCRLAEGCDHLGVPAPDGVECLVVHSCDVLVSLARLRIPQGMHVTVHTHHPVSGM